MVLEQECRVTCIPALGVKLLDYIIFTDIECSDVDLLPCSYVVQELDSVKKLIIIVTDSITSMLIHFMKNNGKKW